MSQSVSDCVYLPTALIGWQSTVSDSYSECPHMVSKYAVGGVFEVLLCVLGTELTWVSTGLVLG